MQTIGIAFLSTNFDVELHALIPKCSSPCWLILGFPLTNSTHCFFPAKYEVELKASTVPIEN